MTASRRASRSFRGYAMAEIDRLRALLLRARDQLNLLIIGQYAKAEPEELVCDIEDALGLERSE